MIKPMATPTATNAQRGLRSVFGVLSVKACVPLAPEVTRRVKPVAARQDPGRSVDNLTIDRRQIREDGGPGAGSGGEFPSGGRSDRLLA